MSEPMHKADLVITNIGQAYTARPATDDGPDDPSLAKSTFVPELIQDAVLVAGDGVILHVGGSGRTAASSGSSSPRRSAASGGHVSAGASASARRSAVSGGHVSAGASASARRSAVSGRDLPSDLEDRFDLADATVVDAGGALLTPGLIDCHTHLVFAGSRHDEYALRAVGSTYQQIGAAGRGIRASVRHLRAASEEDLLRTGRVRLAQMLATGTTTVEIKSGYGQSTESELKTLAVIGRLGEEGPQRILATFLGAHAVPDEYQERAAEGGTGPRDAKDSGRRTGKGNGKSKGTSKGKTNGKGQTAYVDLVVEEMLPAIVEQGIARFCDVFCETGYFTVEESERILATGQQAGLGAKIHSDEFDALGGTEMAARIGALSADHLTALTPSGIAALAGSGTVPVLLPGTTTFLGMTDYAPARALLGEGAPVALATDFNPGSSAFMSLPLILTLACSQLHMHPAEALQGVTVNAARALGLQGEVGVLEPGRAADLVLWDAEDYRQIPYAAGRPIVSQVFIGGRRVYPF